MSLYRYHELDVFTDTPLLGNALAVVHDATGLDDARLQAFARWTNFSETTFLLPPTDAGADYRVRIFTPDRELPFAGHPTLGSCHAWLAAGGRPRRDGARLAFAAPPLRRGGPVDADTLAQIVRSLRIPADAIRAARWVDNGPGWVAVLLESADAVLALQPDFVAMRGLELGVVGPWPSGAAQFEVRAFVPSLGVPEDPVTGSLNAGLGQWLIGAGLAPERYVAAQGTALGRAGRVFVERIDGQVWVGGGSVVVVDGQVTL